MSPEQAKGESLDLRSDQFSLGAILYEMATGRRAFERDSAVQTLAAIVEDDPEPVAGASPSTSPRIARVIQRCLRKDPGDRYRSTEDIARDLELREPEQRERRFPVAAAIAIVAAVLIVVAFALRSGVFTADVGDVGTIDSVAVLPLDNLSADPEQEYFADGMTEALIADLAKLGTFRVISRTSAMRYKDSDEPLPEIAKELGVDAVVEGSVLRAGDQVRITAQLISAESDEHLWAESYEGDLTDVLGLQREVARSIAGEIGALLDKPSGPEAQIEPAAYDAYLRATSYFHQRALDEAIAHFQEAIRLEPGFAPAHAGLGRAYMPRRQVALARRAAERALELDPELAEAHAVLANVLWFEWQWQASLDRYQRAIELNADNPDISHSYSLLLSRLGRLDESIEQQALAVELDPCPRCSRRKWGVGWPSPVDWTSPSSNWKRRWI